MVLQKKNMGKNYYKKSNAHFLLYKKSCKSGKFMR